MTASSRDDHSAPESSPSEARGAGQPTEDVPEGPDGTGRRHGRDRGARTLVTRVAGDALSVRRAFGEPIRQGETMLVPVARVTGGSGSGHGSGGVGGGGGDSERASARGEASGSGAGGAFAVRVKPIGVYVVRGADVQWQPALDLGRVILGGQLVGLVAVVAVSWAVRRRGRRR